MSYPVWEDARSMKTEDRGLMIEDGGNDACPDRGPYGAGCVAFAAANDESRVSDALYGRRVEGANVAGRSKAPSRLTLPAQSMTMGSAWNMGVIRREVILDCGGRRSAG